MAGSATMRRFSGGFIGPDLSDRIYRTGFIGPDLSDRIAAITVMDEQGMLGRCDDLSILRGDDDFTPLATSEHHASRKPNSH